MPVILATQEAEIRRIAVRSQPGQIAPKTLSQINPSRERACEVAQGSNPGTAHDNNKQQKNKSTKPTRRSTMLSSE
jgi:hypothetical protein